MTAEFKELALVNDEALKATTGGHQTAQPEGTMLGPGGIGPEWTWPDNQRRDDGPKLGCYWPARTSSC